MRPCSPISVWPSVTLKALRVFLWLREEIRQCQMCFGLDSVSPKRTHSHSGVWRDLSRRSHGTESSARFHTNLHDLDGTHGVVNTATLSAEEWPSCAYGDIAARSSYRPPSQPRATTTTVARTRRRDVPRSSRLTTLPELPSCRKPNLTLQSPSLEGPGRLRRALARRLLLDVLLGVGILPPLALLSS